MQSQAITHQITNNNAFCLELISLGTAATIKLIIKVSKNKKDVYQITLNSLNDIKRLENNFENFEDFKQYIKDLGNIRVDIQNKIIKILVKSQNVKIKSLIEVASLQLVFDKSIEDRRYLTKEELRYEQLMLMLASSAKRQSIQRHLERRFQPLKGVNYDIDYFQDRFEGNRIHCFESSYDEGMILSKQYVLKALQKYLSKPAQNFYLFYSGHGDQDPLYKGEIVLESPLGANDRRDQPDKYSIGIQQVVKIWSQKRLCKQSHLYIFMDFCFSGKWCEKLSKMNENTISILTACTSQQKSYGQDGGLFFKTIMGGQKQFQENYRRLVKKQYPIFIKGSKNLASLSKNHLKLLCENIKNVQNFHSDKQINDISLFPRIAQKKILVEATQISHYQQRIRALEEENKKLNDLIVNFYEKKIKKLQYFMTEYKKSQEKIEDDLKLNFIEKLFLGKAEGKNQKKQAKNQNLARDFADPDCFYHHFLMLSSSTIRANYDWCRVIGRTKIQGQYSFTVIFTKITKFVTLGVIDTQYKNFQWEGQNWIRYFSTGKCFVGVRNNVANGSGFKVGQLIKVTIDINSGTLQWKVGLQIKYEAKFRILTDKKIIWVPWIWLNNKGDEAIICQ